MTWGEVRGRQIAAPTRYNATLFHLFVGCDILGAPNHTVRLTPIRRPTPPPSPWQGEGLGRTHRRVSTLLVQSFGAVFLLVWGPTTPAGQATTGRPSGLSLPAGWFDVPATPSVACGDSSPVKGALRLRARAGGDVCPCAGLRAADCRPYTVQHHVVPSFVGRDILGAPNHTVRLTLIRRLTPPPSPVILRPQAEESVGSLAEGAVTAGD